MQSAGEEKRTNSKSAAEERCESVLSYPLQLNSENGFQRSFAFGMVKSEEE